MASASSVLTNGLRRANNGALTEWFADIDKEKFDAEFDKAETIGEFISILSEAFIKYRIEADVLTRLLNRRVRDFTDADMAELSAITNAIGTFFEKMKEYYM